MMALAFKKYFNLTRPWVIFFGAILYFLAYSSEVWAKSLCVEGSPGFVSSEPRAEKVQLEIIEVLRVIKTVSQTQSVELRELSPEMDQCFKKLAQLIFIETRKTGPTDGAQAMMKAYQERLELVRLELGESILWMNVLHELQSYWNRWDGHLYRSLLAQSLQVPEALSSLISLSVFAFTGGISLFRSGLKSALSIEAWKELFKNIQTTLLKNARQGLDGSIRLTLRGGIGALGHVATQTSETLMATGLIALSYDGPHALTQEPKKFILPAPVALLGGRLRLQDEKELNEFKQELWDRVTVKSLTALPSIGVGFALLKFTQRFAVQGAKWPTVVSVLGGTGAFLGLGFLEYKMISNKLKKRHEELTESFINRFEFFKTQLQSGNHPSGNPLTASTLFGLENLLESSFDPLIATRVYRSETAMGDLLSLHTDVRSDARSLNPVERAKLEQQLKSKWQKALEKEDESGYWEFTPNVKTVLTNYQYQLQQELGMEFSSEQFLFLDFVSNLKDLPAQTERVLSELSQQKTLPASVFELELWLYAQLKKLAQQSGAHLLSQYADRYILRSLYEKVERHLVLEKNFFESSSDQTEGETL